MSQENKTVSGILSFLPLVAFIAYMIVFFSFIFNVMPELDRNPSEEEIIFPYLFNMIIFAIILGIVSLGVLVYFIIHAVNNKTIDGTERLVWILIFIFTGMVGFPIYWYMRIQRNQTL